MGIPASLNTLGRRFLHDQDPLRKSTTTREGGKRPPSLALMKREVSGRGQPAGRGGTSLQPQQNEAMQYQGQGDGEGGHHDQRIGRHE
jgi:hypothetical protein